MRNFANSFITIENIRFYEYQPLVNSRCHSLHTDKANILNKEFRKQYEDFLSYLIEMPQITNTQQLCLLYYLLIQDRINEAIKVYQKIDPKSFEGNPTCKIQYDYCSAYLDFFLGFPNFKVARNICENYLDYPVIHWRNLFYEIANHLAEYDGEELKKEKTDEDSKNKKTSELTDKEEVLNTNIEGKTITISYQNVENIEINFYKIDIEVLFSRTPFLQNNSDDFSYIKPNYSSTHNVKKTKDLQKITINVPEQFEKSNVSVLIKSQNLKRTLNYFSSSLQVQLFENYGQIKVLDPEEKPFSKVYIKCFAKTKSGAITFYKDGYTDLIGRFDYASQNNSNLSDVEKFSLLIMSDELGCLIKEANVPSNLGKIEKTVELKAVEWQKRADINRNITAQTYAQNVLRHKMK